MGRNAKGRADREVAKAIALDLPDVELATHHGTLDIRVRNKIFATFPAEGKVVQLRCTPEDLTRVTAENPEVFSRFRGDNWMQVSLDHVGRDRLHQLLIDAWMVAAPPALLSLYADRLKKS